MRLTAGSNLLHYRLVEPIGEGGMGVVWRAIDTKLDRAVALKLLPEGMASTRVRLKRLKREARAVAALNHPHIVTIHSVDETEGIHWSFSNARSLSIRSSRRRSPASSS